MGGHSLGGGLASAAAVVTGAKGYTFNAAGLHPYTVLRAPYNILPDKMRAQGKLIDAYHSTADPLTNIQDHSPPPVISPGAPQALGIPHPLRPAPQWQHEWGELASRHPFNAAKRMGLEGHGVNPQIVDAIEHEKDQDTATLTKYLASAP